MAVLSKISMIPDHVLRLFFEAGFDLFHIRPFPSKIPRYPYPRSDETSTAEKEARCVRKYRAFGLHIASVNKHWYSMAADIPFEILFLAGDERYYAGVLNILQNHIGPNTWFEKTQRAGYFVKRLDITILSGTESLINIIANIIHCCSRVEFVTIRIQRSTSVVLCQFLLSNVMTTIGRHLLQFEWFVPTIGTPLCIGNYLSIMANLCYLDIHDMDWNTPLHVRYVFLPNLHTLRLKLTHTSLMNYVNTWRLPSLLGAFLACLIRFQSIRPLLDFFSFNGRKLQFLQLEGIPEDPALLRAILEECPNVSDLVIDSSLSTNLDIPLPFSSIRRLGLVWSSVYDIPIYVADLVTLVYDGHLFINCNEIHLLEYNRINMKTCYSVDSAHVLIRAIDRAERIRCDREFALLDNEGIPLEKKDVWVQVNVPNVFVPYSTGLPIPGA